MWLDKQVSFYECAADNKGTQATFRQILLCRFAVEHRYYYKIYPADKQAYPKGKWINGISNDLDTIIELNKGSLKKSDQALLKQTMQCFTPAALLKSKKKGAIEEIKRTGMLQLDFDYHDIKEYCVEELKRAVFSLPFVAFCSLSCSGRGFYALVSIAEPEKLNEYAEHCFNVLKDYGIKADTTKGRNVQDLRFVSYDSNMLIRENPEPLLIKRFKRAKQAKEIAANKCYQTYPKSHGGFLINNSKIVQNGLKAISEAQPGNRWRTVQKVSYTLGGLGDNNILFDIKNCINTTSSFFGEETKYKECAEVCFIEGKQRPLQKIRPSRN